ncbi:hypothetical protein PBAL39_25005 [Pedobacter sp. BAL39]|uniref:DUF3857 domain-containing protein n=1 Tax=Pedobacter sp. BAL39 TaxID=391596 RepID=UPI000155A01F|nr:DUF3857 domain-containing protein [Pedobacter sp. BAL39]EDM36587.1 hypothetical protein PBAL39_25005 [Pedobacter sp. BAL39]
MKLMLSCRKSIFLGLSFLGFFNVVKAQGTYDVAKIPAALLANASVVVRLEDQVYDLKNAGAATYEYKTAVTIINKNGESASNMSEYYDNFSSISNLKATMFDAKGTKIKDYKSSDFKDRSAISGYSLYESSRVKYLEFLQSNYPYTIEYSYTVTYNGMTSYPSWRPVSRWGYAVEQSSYTFRIPQSMNFKYLKSQGLKTDSTFVKDKIQYKWSCSAIPAMEYEPLSTGLRNLTPWVSLAPNEFEYDHTKGNITDWKNLGAWMYGLSSDRQVLSEPARAKVQQLIKDVKTDQEKIRILYQYLQQNTRYVSVQLGIGGLRPIAADKVSAVNYGDCKGLSNYMKAMLQEAGIKSNLVVIGNDMPSLNAAYASLDQANHMILCVPGVRDTTWLECTSNYKPAGFIGNSNADRLVLLITEEGGKLVKTPVYSPLSNYQKRHATVDLDDSGNASIQLQTNYGNAQYEDNMGIMLMEPVEQHKRLMHSLDIPNVNISSYTYTQPDKNLPVLEEKISLKSSQLMSNGGGKLFITLNLLNRQENTLSTIENRKTAFAVNYGYVDEDEITYHIPKGYKVEFVPKDLNIESEFGKYSCQIRVKDNTIVYRRTKSMTNKKYPAEKYNEYVAFNKKLYQADKLKTILAKVE